jgi:hypothetical protein
MFVIQHFRHPALNLLYFTTNNRPMITSMIDGIGQVAAGDKDKPIFNQN